MQHEPLLVQVAFAAVSFGSFVCLGLLCYALYGWDFVAHAYLYHGTRTDFKHSFSPTFYVNYLALDPSAPHVKCVRRALIDACSCELLYSTFMRMPTCIFAKTS